MQKELTEDQKKFLTKTLSHRKEKVEELAYHALTEALAEDIPVFELPYYTLQRARQIIEEAFSKVNFNNPKLIKARKTFLKACLEEAKSKIETLPGKPILDETDARDKDCEPVAQKIAHLILNKDLIFSDEDYFDQVLANEEAVPLSAAVAGYANALDEKLTMVVSEHWRRATEKQWGVEKESVTFSMLDAELKRE